MYYTILIHSRPLFFLLNHSMCRPVSIGALISTSVACILIVVKVTTDSGNAQPVSQPHLETKDAFMAFGTLCFAFGGHAVFPTIQVDMKEPKKFGKAVFIAYFSKLLGFSFMFDLALNISWRV